MIAGATAATAGEAALYGKIHLSIDSMDNGASAPNDDDGIFVSSNSSRLGIKGSEDLGGGLSAVYKYEMQTDYSSQKIAGNRNAYLGLKGGFGQVIAGRHDMPFKTVGRKFDLFGDTIGDNRAITRLKMDTDGNGKTDDWADRRDDVLMYSGTFGAVSVALALGQEESTDKKADTGIGITYKQGPIKVMFANETHGKGNFGAGLKDSTGNIIAGAYSMGNMMFAAGYMAISDVDGNAGVDVNGYTLAASMKSGANTFKFQWTNGEADCTGCTKTAATQMALGVDHSFTKNTTAYAVWTSIDNEDNIDFNFSDTGHDATVAAGGDGDDPSGFSVGLIHKF
jgi:predicted porin